MQNSAPFDSESDSDYDYQSSDDCNSFDEQIEIMNERNQRIDSCINCMQNYFDHESSPMSYSMRYVTSAFLNPMHMPTSNRQAIFQSRKSNITINIQTKNGISAKSLQSVSSIIGANKPNVVKHTGDDYSCSDSEYEYDDSSYDEEEDCCCLENENLQVESFHEDTSQNQNIDISRVTHEQPGKEPEVSKCSSGENVETKEKKPTDEIENQEKSVKQETRHPSEQEKEHSKANDVKKTIDEPLSERVIADIEKEKIIQALGVFAPAPHQEDPTEKDLELLDAIKQDSIDVHDTVIISEKPDEISIEPLPFLFTD